METKTIVQEVKDLAKEFYTFIYNELVLLGKQSGIGPDQEVPYRTGEIKWYLEDNGYPLLDDDLANKIQAYMKDVCGKEINVEELKEKWIKDTKGIETLIALRSVLPEWWRYISEEENGCQIWLVESYVNKNRFGGVFVFYNQQKKNYIVFQGIAKYIIPTIAHALYPDCQVNKLNSLLDEGIQSIARLKNCKRIYVKPLDKQMDILEKYYGYKYFNKNDMFTQFYNCKLIYQAQGYWMYKDVSPIDN